jgi:hypothetical protein
VRYQLVPVLVEGAKERIPEQYGHLTKDVETWGRAMIWARGRLEPGRDLSCEELIGDAICAMSNLRRVMGNPLDARAALIIYQAL